MSYGKVAKYAQQSVMTATPEDCVVLLYDGAIRFALQMREAVARGDIEAKAESLGRVNDILTELAVSLDHAVAPEFSQRLSSLYYYMMNTLSQAGVRMETGGIDVVLKHLRDLREAWAEAREIVKQEKSANAQGPGE
jgi:flagellar protein FliS